MSTDGAVGAGADPEEAGHAIRLLETMSAAFVALDRGWRVTYANGQALALLGLTHAEMVGHDHWELFPATVGTEFEATYRRAVATGEPQSIEAYYPAPYDAWYEISAWPTDEGLGLHFADVDERHVAQELLALGSRAGERLGRSVELEDALDALAEVVVPLLADWSVATVLEPDASVRDTATWHVDPGMREAVRRLAATRASRGGTAITAAVARSGEPHVVPSGAREVARGALASAAALGALDELAIESVVVVPVRVGDEPIGTLTLVRGPERSAMSQAELGVATSIAARGGLALQNARLYAQQKRSAAELASANRALLQIARHDRSVAAALQDAMLTRLPEPAHLQLAARYLAAHAEDQVGGDWYDALVLPDGATMLTIGDVVGHDIHAAGTMGQLRSMLRALACDRGGSPADLVTRLDRASAQLDVAGLATLLTVRIEAAPRGDERALTWTSAGHPTPVLLAPDRPATLLEAAPDLLLGVDVDAARHDHRALVPAGSVLLLHTDGLIERRSRGIDAGQRELLASVEEHRDLPLQELVDRVIEQVVGARQGDDVAVLAVHLD